MKLKVAIVMMVSLMLALGLAGTALGQSWCDSSVAVSAEYGLPGDTVVVSGTALYGDTVTVTFDGVEVASTEGDVDNEFSTSFVVPNKAAGDYEIVIAETGEGDRTCTKPFTVRAAAAPAAEVPVATTPATLPATGFMLVPAGGLLAGGLGMLLFRKRRR